MSPEHLCPVPTVLCPQLNEEVYLTAPERNAQVSEAQEPVNIETVIWYRYIL